MRLHFKEPKAVVKEETSNKEKEEKKIKDKKIKRASQDPYKNANYSDTKETRFSNIVVNIRNLKYGHILEYGVTELNIEGEKIKIESTGYGSWHEVILMMLDTIRVNSKDKFLETLAEKGVTSQRFVVDTVYGMQTTGKNQIGTYKLFDTGYYIEMYESVDSIYKAIISLVKALEIKPTLIEFSLQNIKHSSVEIELKELEDEAIAVPIDESLPYFDNNTFLMNTKLFSSFTDTDRVRVRVKIGESLRDATTLKTNEPLLVKTHHIQEVLVQFIAYVCNNYSKKDQEKLKLIKGNTFITSTEKVNTALGCVKIPSIDYYIYSDCEPESIVYFIATAMRLLDMHKDDVMLYFRRKKESYELKEWEFE